MATIFIQIASFNDDELVKTVNDCIEKSSKDNELFFGIHECYIDNKTEFNLNNVKIQYSKAPENIGVGQGRYLANKFYNNENYYLQIDSHSRFRNNWDTILINDLNDNIDKIGDCVLSTYPARYWYENDIEVLEDSTFCSSIKFKKDLETFESFRILHQEAEATQGELCTSSVSAAFIFGPGSIANVIQHPAVFYWGEELLKAVSLYTNNYNLMVPKTNVIYHLYGIDSKRVPVWNIYPIESNNAEEFSKYAIKTILLEDRKGPIYLGDKRSLKQYGRYIGVDFKNGTFI